MSEELIKRLRKIGDRVPAPCPDGIKGCLVFHFSVETDPTCAEAADTIEAQAAEIERLREALRGMIDYSCYSERWQDDHPEYVAAARAALGETE